MSDPTGRRCQIITITGRKGGVGKTSLAYFLATRYAEMKRKVLAIDLDPQGNLTWSLSGNFLDGQTDLWLTQGSDPQTVPLGLDCTAGGKELTSARIQSLWPTMLSERIERCTQWDTFIIDCPPGSPHLEQLGIAAADVQLICTDAHPYGLSGAIELMGEWRTGRERSRPVAARAAFVLTRVLLTRTADRELPDILREEFPEAPQFLIRQDANLAAATANQIPLSEGCRAWDDIEKIREWIDD